MDLDNGDATAQGSRAPSSAHARDSVAQPHSAGKDVNELSDERKSKEKKAGNKGGNGDKPTEEQIEKLEEKLEAAQADQKNLFLIIFQVRGDS